MKAFAPVGNGRVLAYVMGEALSYVRGTNVLRVLSEQSETRFAAVGDEIQSASHGQRWPEVFDPPPLGGATRAAIVDRIPGFAGDAAVTDVYARSVLVLAAHQEVSGAFIARPEEAVMLAHALDICGERGAAEAFFAWAISHRSLDGLLMWGLEQHIKHAHGTELLEPYQRLKNGPGPTLAATPPPLPRATVRALRALMRKRSSLGLFLREDGIDLGAHARFLVMVHGLVPKARGGEDFFFDHQAQVQDVRRARALYGGAFHGGLTPVGRDPRLDVEVRADLRPASITMRPAGGSKYKIEVESVGGAFWASDSDPRLGGQEFAQATVEPPPDWVHDAVVYHVMVDRFARPGSSLPPPGSSTALYGGTLDGIREHLDHIAGLGCNTVWLSPVHKSPSHHGYDHEDFFTVEPRYGGESALRSLIDAAHSRGMRVLLDFVPNHTGRGHHLFREAIAHGGEAAEHYRFWQWPHYYRCFFDHIALPELDTGSDRVQEYLTDAARHWVKAYGADGLRCDHVAGVDPAFWVELLRALRAVKPDAVVLGEATGHFDWLARYAGRLHAIFDFEFAHVVRQAFARGRMDAAAFSRWLDGPERAFSGIALATLLDNHDMNRFLWMAGGSVARLKLAATLLMTLPGMPVIYYGTEVGLTQRYDAAIENAEARLPMLWGAEQSEDLLAHFQQLGRWRRESTALRRGERRTLLVDGAVLAYERVLDGERVIVALNLSERPQKRDVSGEPVDLPPLGWTVIDKSSRDGGGQDDVLGMRPHQRTS